MSKIGFLDLPAELRNDIYIRSLVKGYPIRICKPARQKSRRRPRSLVNLLFVNRQVNVEATTIFYGLNKFQPWTSADTYYFLEGLRPATISALSSLRLPTETRRGGRRAILSEAICQANNLLHKYQPGSQKPKPRAIFVSLPFPQPGRRPHPRVWISLVHIAELEIRIEDGRWRVDFIRRRRRAKIGDQNNTR